jgi:hypothetical protein
MIQDRQRAVSRSTHEKAQFEQEIATRVKAELGNSTYHPIRRVLCELRNGILVLRGQVPSYFLKQIAQTLVHRRANGSIRIDNQLEVVYDR